MGETLEELKENNKTGKEIEQSHPGYKEKGRNNEITKGDNSGHRNPRKEDRNHRSKHQQQNTRDRRENLRS